MTKENIADKINDITGIEKKAILAIIDAFMESVKEEVISGENVYLRGFGTFETAQRAQITARNVACGTSIVVPPHRIPKFKPSPEFKKMVK